MSRQLTSTIAIEEIIRCSNTGNPNEKLRKIQKRISRKQQQRKMEGKKEKGIEKYNQGTRNMSEITQTRVNKFGNFPKHSSQAI